MVPPQIHFIKTSSIYVAFLHHYAACRYFYYKTFLFLFQKRFLLKICPLFLDIITIRLHILRLFHTFQLFSGVVSLYLTSLQTEKNASHISMTYVFLHNNGCPHQGHLQSWQETNDCCIFSLQYLSSHSCRQICLYLF